MTKIEKAEFVTMVKGVTPLELLDLFAEYDTSDDWDGAFTDDQSWKRDICYKALAKRLAKLS
jgi:hypothetical protein